MLRTHKELQNFIFELASSAVRGNAIIALAAKTQMITAQIGHDIYCRYLSQFFFSLNRSRIVS